MKYLIDFIVLGIIYFFIFFKKWKSRGKDVLFTNTTMYIYLSFVLYFTLMPTVVSVPTMFNHPYTPMELTPFADVLSGRGDFIRQVVLNIIMTIPFGFLFPHIIKEKFRFAKAVICCFLLSLIIEVLQPLINGLRSSDITDLITNTVGGIIGYLFYLILRPLTTKFLKFINGR